MNIQKLISDITEKLFCKHKWNREASRDIQDEKGSVVGFWSLYICQKCGKMEQIKKYG